MSILDTNSRSKPRSSEPGPPQPRSTGTAFGDIAYLESGQGPAALFLHGVFLNAGLWRHQLRALADIRRCLAVDLLAHGRSPCPPPGRDLTLELQADMALGLLDALGLEAVDLVGNDSGGAIAQLIAVRCPRRVRTLTLTNCDTHDNWPPPAFAPVFAMARAGTLADALGTLAGDPRLARAALASGFENPDNVDDETITGFFAPFASPARAGAVQDYVAGMDPAVTVAIHEALAALDVPTLIVWGTADEFFDVAWATWLATTIPGTVACVELAGAKLFFPVERPEAFNAQLRALWTRTAPAAA